MGRESFGTAAEPKLGEESKRRMLGSEVSSEWRVIDSGVHAGRGSLDSGFACHKRAW